MKIMKTNTKTSLIALAIAVVLAIPLVFAADRPENVTGVSAAPVDTTSIAVSWNAAKDAFGGLVDHYRVYYGTTSVQQAGVGTYDSEIDTPNNNTSYMVTGLTPATTYYFTVTAFDSAGEESDAYAPEASADTPAEEGGEEPAEEDVISPTVISANAVDKTHVQLVFSEAVKLPVLTPEAAFTIVEQANAASLLEVTGVTIDDNDSTGKTVLLETAEQVKNVNYVVTAGVLVTDMADNPIVDGNADSALFTGTDVEPAGEPSMEELLGGESEAPAEGEAATEEEAPAAPSGESMALDCDEDMAVCWLPKLTVCTPAKVKTDINEPVAFELEITGEDAEGNCVVHYKATKHSNVQLMNTEMDCNVPKGTYNEEEYQQYIEENMMKECEGDYVDKQPDTTPPEDITGLMLSFKEMVDTFTVIMDWTASVNSAKDLFDQIMYMSIDRGKNYDNGKSLGPSVTHNEVSNLEGGKEYTFKITTKDASGNESVGVVKSIRLPQTGVGVGLMLLGSAAAANFVLRRKKQ